MKVFLPQIRQWVHKRVQMYAKIVNFAIEKPMLSKDLFELMADFMRKIVLIQRAGKVYILIKSVRLDVLKKKINSIRDTFVLKRSLSIKQSPKKQEKIPKLILQEYLSKYYANQLRKYVNRIKDYKKELQLASYEYDEYLKENIIENLLYGKVLDNEPRQVPRPILRLYSDRDSLNETIYLAATHLSKLNSLQGRNRRTSVRTSTVMERNFSLFFN